MSHSAENVRRAGSIAALGLMARTLSQVLTLILVILAGRFLTHELFGIFALSVILINLTQVLLYSGVYNYVLKEPNLEKDIGTAFSLHSLSAFLFAGITALAGGIVWFFQPGELLPKLMFATVPLPLVALVACWQEAITLRRGKVRFYYITMPVTDIAAFATGAWMLANGFGVWALIASRYVLELARCLFMSLSAGVMPIPAFARDAAKRIISYCAGLYGGSGLTFFNTYYSDIIIGSVLSEAAVGIFRMGTRMATAAFDVFGQTTRILSWQIFGRLAREKRLQDPVWVKMFAATITIMASGLGSMALLGDDLTYVVLGEKWLRMVPILQIVCIVRIVSSFDLVASAHIMAADRSSFVFKARLGEAIILGLALTGAVFYGATAVALGMIPSAIFLLFVLLKEICRLTHTPIAQVWRTLVPGVFIVLATIGTAAVFQQILEVASPMYRLVACTSAGLAAMFIASLLVFRSWTLDLVHELSGALQHESSIEETDLA